MTNKLVNLEAITYIIPSIQAPIGANFILCCEPKWINKLDRVRYVLVDIDPAGQPDGVFRYESPATRIIVSVAVIPQPRLRILLLPLKPIGFLGSTPAAFDTRAITSRASPQARYDASHTTSPTSSVISNGVPIWSQW